MIAQKGWFSWFDNSLPPAEACALKSASDDIPARGAFGPYYKKYLEREGEMVKL